MENWPDWWRLDACRSNAALVDVAPVELGGCSELWAGGAFADGSFELIPFQEIPGSPHGGFAPYLRANIDVATLEPLAIQPGVKYYAFSLRIRRVRTVGANACAGCCVGACMRIGHFDVVTDLGPFRIAGRGGTSLSWQGGSPGLEGLCFGGCAVPTRSGTWGEIKTLYR